MKLPPKIQELGEVFRKLKLPEFLQRMNPRERLTILLGAGAALLVIFLGFVILPVSREKRELREQIMLKTQELKEMMLLSQEFEGVKSVQGSRGIIPPDFSILSYLEGLADQSRIRGKIEYMRPGNADSKAKNKEMSVEIKLNAVSLSELIDLLFRIEKGGATPLIVNRIVVRSRFANPRELDATLTVIGMASS